LFVQSLLNDFGLGDFDFDHFGTIFDGVSIQQSNQASLSELFLMQKLNNIESIGRGMKYKHH